MVVGEVRHGLGEESAKFLRGAFGFGGEVNIVERLAALLIEERGVTGGQSGSGFGVSGDESDGETLAVFEEAHVRGHALGEPSDGLIRSVNHERLEGVLPVFGQLLGHRSEGAQFGGETGEGEIQGGEAGARALEMSLSP